MKAARLVCGVLATAWLSCTPAFGQPQQRFPSPMPESDLPAAASAETAPGPLPGPTPGGYGPQATFGGTVDPLPPNFDPYATPGATPQTMYPEGSNYQYGSAGFGAGATAAYAQARRFFHGFRLGYLWMPGTAPDELGVQDVELDGTFEFPFFFNADSPLLITPGFAVHYWAGPVSQGAEPADLPPRTYDAFLDTAWNPQYQWIGGELSFRIGVYSDFSRVINDSFRYMGKGLLVLQPTATMKIKGGVWYLDRNEVKLLPAGGVVWTPSPDVRFDILFPNPRFSKRLSNIQNTEMWFFMAGEYGGGNWTVKRGDVGGPADGNMDSVDYNDMRFGVGLEFNNPGRIRGLFEIGVAFEREIVYRNGPPKEFNPNTTVYLRAGLSR